MLYSLEYGNSSITLTAFQNAALELGASIGAALLFTNPYQIDALEAGVPEWQALQFENWYQIRALGIPGITTGQALTVTELNQLLYLRNNALEEVFAGADCPSDIGPQAPLNTGESGMLVE